MALVLGIDPGLTGAMTIINETGVIEYMADIPTWRMALKNGKSRARVDVVTLINMMQSFSLMGVDLAVLEAVGGRPKQSASAGFVFGYTVGAIYTSLIHAKIPVDTVEPATWKKLMRCPKDDEGISHRADEVFPDHRDMWRTPRGRIMHDRAESALLAKFGMDHALHAGFHSNRASRDPENEMVYRNVMTGA